MDGFPVRQKDNPKVAIFHLWDLNPTPKSTVLLPGLPNRGTQGTLHPLVQDCGPIRPGPHSIKVGGGLHSEYLTDCGRPGQCRRTSRIRDWTPNVRRTSADLYARKTVGRVQFIVTQIAACGC